MSAILRVRVTSGAVRTFDAELVTTEAGMVTAVGRWRHHRGRHHRYSWSSGRVLEIRWGVVS